MSNHHTASRPADVSVRPPSPCFSQYPLEAPYEPDQHLAAAPTYEDACILRQ